MIPTPTNVEGSTDTAGACCCASIVGLDSLRWKTSVFRSGSEVMSGADTNIIIVIGAGSLERFPCVVSWWLVFGAIVLVLLWKRGKGRGDVGHGERYLGSIVRSMTTPPCCDG